MGLLSKGPKEPKKCSNETCTRTFIGEEGLCPHCTRMQKGPTKTRLKEYVRGPRIGPRDKNAVEVTCACGCGRVFIRQQEGHTCATPECRKRRLSILAKARGRNWDKHWTKKRKD